MKYTKFLFLVILAFISKQSFCQSNKKPNVLFIAVDDFNDWNDILRGHPQAKTPNYDKLVSKGLVFTNAHCAAPACGPSRAAIMSGIRPSTSGNYTNPQSFSKNSVLNNSITMPEFFQQNGYYVCGSGKLYHSPHFNKELKGRGFNEYYPSMNQDRPSENVKFSRPRPLNGIVANWAKWWDWGPYHSDITLDQTSDGKVARWAEEKLLGGELKEPFFMGVGIFRPHLPFYTPQKYFDMFPIEDIQIPEGYKEDDLSDISGEGLKMGLIDRHETIVKAGQWKSAIQGYLASIAMMDDCLGQIIDALEKSRFADNTIIVMWSDHGYQLGEKKRWAKFTLWERSTKVNMIWVVPNLTIAGSICKEPVNLLDIYSTLVSLIGAQAPKNQLEGDDLSSLIKNPNTHWGRATLTTNGYKNYSVRSDHYRYIVYVDGTEELYDHEKDKWEWNNLVKDPKYADIKKDLARWLPMHHAQVGVSTEK
jgi:arylsulfatase A-like enzyme